MNYKSFKINKFSTIIFIFTFFIKNFCSTDTLKKIQLLKAKVAKTSELSVKIKNNISNQQVAVKAQINANLNTTTVTNNINENTSKQNTVAPSNTKQNINTSNISATNTQQNVVSLDAYKQQQLELLTLKIPAIEAENNDLKSKNALLQKKNDKLNDEIISLTTENNKLKEQLKNQQNTPQINNTNINNKQNVTQTNNQTNTQKQKSSINKKQNTKKSSWISAAKNAKIKIFENEINKSKKKQECEDIIKKILSSIEKISKEANENIASLKWYNELIEKAKNKIEQLKSTTNNSNNQLLPPNLDSLGVNSSNSNVEQPPMLDILVGLSQTDQLVAPPNIDILGDLSKNNNDSNNNNNNNLLPPMLDILGGQGTGSNNNNVQMPPNIDILGDLSTTNTTVQNNSASEPYDQTNALFNEIRNPKIKLKKKQTKEKSARLSMEKD